MVKTYTEVAQLLKIKVSAFRRWVNRLAQAARLAGLQEQSGRGRKRRLPASVGPDLQTAVEQLHQQSKGA